MLCAVPLWIVRHALAGTKDRWEPGLDRYRPLSRRGIRQAEALLDWFDHPDRAVDAVYSRPTVRCLETVFGVAERRGLPLLLRPELGVGDPAGALRLASSQLGTANALLCSHGEVIPGLLQALELDVADGPLDRCAKGALWTVEVVGGRRRGTYLEPGRPSA